MIHALDVSFSYGANPVLEHINISISETEFVGIIGPNGAGKSTLLKIISGILTPASGSVKLRGKVLAEYQRKDLARIIGFVGQEFKAAFNFSVYEIVLMGRYPYLSPFSNETQTDRDIISAAMNETDVWQFRDRKISDLSGGEKQRVVLASALAQEPEILLLDEPTTALDIKHQMRFYEILAKLQSEKSMTIGIVTHDINLAARFCKRLVVIKDGNIAADDSPSAILNRELMETIYEVPVEIMTHPGTGKPMLISG